MNATSPSTLMDIRRRDTSQDGGVVVDRSAPSWRWRGRLPADVAMPRPWRGCSVGFGELHAQRLLVGGLGAVGGVAFDQASRLGIGRLIGVDPDDYDSDSNLTQPVNVADAGQPKALVRGKRAAAINRSVDVTTVKDVVQHLSCGTLHGADVYLAAGDNIEMLVWLGVQAMNWGKVLIQGAVDPDTWSAIVRCWDLTDPDSPCPACALSAPEWANQRNRIGCDGRHLPQSESTRSLPTICSTAGQLAITEAVKWLTGSDGGLRNEELLVCLRTHRVIRSRLERNPDCRCPHQRYCVSDLACDPATSTLNDVFRDLGLGRRPRAVRSERCWIRSAYCDACGDIPFARFADTDGTVTCACGRRAAFLPFALANIASAVDVSRRLDVPLIDLGIRPGDALGVDADGAWTFVITRPHEPSVSKVRW